MRTCDLMRCLSTACLIGASALLSACQGGRSEPADVQVRGGEPGRGAETIAEIGCGSCHTIPGIDGAGGMVGPPLTSWSKRSYIAGSLPNSPDNLTRWIMNAQAIEPGTAMPDLDVTRQQATDVAAYLYTLE